MEEIHQTRGKKQKILTRTKENRNRTTIELKKRIRRY